MTRKFVFVFSLFLLSFSSCTQDGSIDVNSPLFTILTENGGKWKVVAAKFGDQEVDLSLFTRFRLEFRKDGLYVHTNPDGVLSPSAVLTGSTGKWAEVGKNSIQFDGKVTVREVSSSLSSNKLILEWEVNVPGKVTTTYRLELGRA